MTSGKMGARDDLPPSDDARQSIESEPSGASPPPTGEIKRLAGEIRVEGRKEFVKRIVQSGYVLVAGVCTLLMLILVAAYFLLLEPRLARHIASIITTERHFATADSQTGKLQGNPLDDYILKVFLTEIAKEKGPHSEYAAKITEAMDKGQIKAAFEIFSKSIGQEIYVLDQMYKRPISVHFGHTDYATYRNQNIPQTRFLF
jgi:hypothetical protein